MSRNPESIKTLPIPGDTDDGQGQIECSDSKEALLENPSYQLSSTPPTQSHTMASQALPPSMNPWEAQALAVRFATTVLDGSKLTL